jgi:hypothetical protein
LFVRRERGMRIETLLGRFGHPVTLTRDTDNGDGASGLPAAESAGSPEGPYREGT